MTGSRKASAGAGRAPLRQPVALRSGFWSNNTVPMLMRTPSWVPAKAPTAARLHPPLPACPVREGPTGDGWIQELKHDGFRIVG